MYRYKKPERILAMAKISEKYADKDRTGYLDNFIYFSEANSSHGPRIKFYGGTSQSDRTKTSPSYGFSKTGPTELKLKNWMNKKNCPNAFNQDYLNQVREFISNNIAILNLVWYKKLSEDDALAYFHGIASWGELLNEFVWIDDYPEIVNCKSDSELHQFCLENNLYRF